MANTNASKRQGFCTVTAGGKKRPVFFGLYTLADIQEHYANLDQQELGKQLKDFTETVKNFKLFITLVWSGFLNGAAYKGEEFPYTIRQVGMWFDEMSDEDKQLLSETMAASKLFGDPDGAESEGSESSEEPGGQKKK